MWAGISVSTNTPVASGSAARFGTSRGCCIATGRHLAVLVRCARRGARTWPGGVGRECAWKTAQADAHDRGLVADCLAMIVLCFQAVTHVSQSGCGRCRSVELVFYDVLLSYIVVRCAFRVGSCRLHCFLLSVVAGAGSEFVLHFEPLLKSRTLAAVPRIASLCVVQIHLSTRIVVGGGAEGFAPRAFG